MKITDNDIKFLTQALDLAKKGRLSCAPNPMVGAIIVKNNEIIGQGFHAVPGGPHAEIVAIKNAKETHPNLNGATIYVTLEPCSTFGKTPPCTSAIIEHGFARVVVGTVDPNPLHAGQGFNILRAKGIEVDLADLDACRDLNEKFNFFIQHKKPFVLAKWAMSLDGKIACYSGDSKWISNPKSRQIVQELRAEYEAIMVGSGTVLADNPQLNVRLDGDFRQPVKVIVDSQCRTPLDAKVFQSGSVIIATTPKAPESKLEKLRDLGFKIFISGSDQVDLTKLMGFLAEQSISSVLVEGGGTLLGSLFEKGLVNRVATFIAPKIIGGADAQTPVAGKGCSKMLEVPELTAVETRQIDQDIMITGIVPAK